MAAHRWQLDAERRAPHSGDRRRTHGERSRDLRLRFFPLRTQKNKKHFKSMKTMTIGIDNGISGGIAAVGQSGHLIAWSPMPIQSARNGNEIDVNRIVDWIDTTTGGRRESAVYCVEEPGGSKSSKAAKSMAGSFHAIRAVLEMLCVRWHRITPQKWQKEMIPGCKSGDTKPRALAAAKQLWPEERWLASDRCRTPHDGGIDAALIAEFARLKL